MSSLRVCCLPLKNYTNNVKTARDEIDQNPTKEATFHAACAQLVSLNFALHEAWCGAPIFTEPVKMRIRRRNLNPTALERLRDMYYRSVERGGETLGRIDTKTVHSSDTEDKVTCNKSSRTDSGNFSM